MSAERCEFTDLLKAECAHCKGVPPPKPPARPSRPAWAEARFRGRCAACGEPYGVGERIEYNPLSGGWVAPCCALDGAVYW